MDVVITAARGAGKTTELIRYAAAEHLTIAPADTVLAVYTAALARSMGARIPDLITRGDLERHAGLYRAAAGLAIDDLDLCIERAFRMPVRAAALSVTAPR